MRHIQLPVANKTAQVNAALVQATADWVLVTDADALLPPGILKSLVSVALSDRGVGAVGAAVKPEPGHAVEKLHWRMMNGMRLRESQAFHVTILAAPCYLFQRSAVPRLPEDVVADDAYVGLAVARGGRRVACLTDEVMETRSPSSLIELLWHKERKARACLREVLRCWRHRDEMSEESGRFVMWRLTQHALAPAVAAIALLAGLAWLVQSFGAAGLGVSILALTLLLIAGQVTPARPMWEACTLTVLLWSALIIGLFRYPWAGLSGSLPRVVAAPREERGAA
jgi:cellulose synthase/poly-beta-1,6-N-acetylglucosamine synthase-like glycosyltransferase